MALHETQNTPGAAPAADCASTKRHKAEEDVSPETLTLRNLRKRFDIPPSTARLLEAQGKIEFFRLPLRGKGARSKVLVNVASVRAFLGKCRKKQPEAAEVAQ